MNDEHILKLAEEMGFFAAFVDTKDVVQDPSFRKFCADNLCGKYNARFPDFSRACTSSTVPQSGGQE